MDRALLNSLLYPEFLGVTGEVFHLLPLSDGFLAHPAAVVSSLLLWLLPTWLLRMPCATSLVAAEFWGAGAVADTLICQLK